MSNAISGFGKKKLKQTLKCVFDKIKIEAETEEEMKILKDTVV
jgi:hypothetical protein